MEEKLVNFLVAHGNAWHVLFLLCLWFFRKWFILPVRRYFKKSFSSHLQILADILEHYFAVQEKKVGATWAMTDTMKSIDQHLAVIVRNFFETEKQ